MTITLIEALQKVKDEDLSKEQLESYFDKMSQLVAELNIEAGELEKEEALFLAERGENESVISRKVTFRATSSGQRLIIVKRYISATKTMLGSIKNRIYGKL